MDVTIVLPTHRRPAQLRLLLASMDVLEDPGVPWEILVVDNDPDGGARGQVAAARVAGRQPGYVHEAARGAVHARNRGIAEAQSDVLVMVDDDVVVDPAWLRLLLLPILEDRADLVGGRVVLDPTVARPRWFDEIVIGAYLTNFDLGPDERPLGPDEFVVTASCAVRRSAAIASGGFASGLGPQGSRQLVSDDVQFVRAVRATGARCHWVPDAVVVHELPSARLDRRWLIERAWLQGRSDWIVDRDELATRRANGSRVALSWLRDQLARRRRDGLGHPAVRFHAACDVARTAGRLAEAASWRRDG